MFADRPITTAVSSRNSHLRTHPYNYNTARAQQPTFPSPLASCGRQLVSQDKIYVPVHMLSANNAATSTAAAAAAPRNGSVGPGAPPSKGKGAGNGVAAAGPGMKRRRSDPDAHAEKARSRLADDDEGRLDKMQKACATLLECLGEDVSREGLVKTPTRMAKALLACTRGYSQSLSDIVNEAVFEEDHHEMILVKDIEIHSLCEHHMVPFTGKVHIAYIPRSKASTYAYVPHSSGLHRLARGLLVTTLQTRRGVRQYHVTSFTKRVL